tara:strand:+ start:1958 stop:2137 length:180 start_codon:yes stop_codon:yes gene_type:complete
MNLIANGMRARYSPVNQAWIVQPFNFKWPDHIAESAPVIKIVSGSIEDVIKFLAEGEDG